MLALIVIDCAEHTIFEDLMSAGRMPVLASLAGRGYTVPLASDGHALDGCVFQTLLTGVNPGKHGIHKYRQLVPGTYDYELSKAARSPVPQIWSVLSGQGKNCCVFDVPKAFAHPGFRGRMVASWGSYSPAANPSSVPDSLYDETNSRFGPHPLRTQKAVPLPAREYEEALDTLLDAVRLRVDVCRWLLESGPFDFLATAFSESHSGAHQFWQLRDPEHPLYDPESARRCGDAMERIYEAIDKHLARLVESLPADATTVVMTQQGVQHNYSGSRFLPEWLARREGRSYEKGALQKVDEMLGSELRNKLRRAIPEPITNRLARHKFSSRGSVYMLPGSEYGALLRVNVEGREPEGVVSRAAYRETLDSLCEDLLQLRNPATGETAVTEIQLTHDRYDGPLLDHLPDAIVCWRNDRPIDSLECPRHGSITEGISFTDITHSMHTDEGWAVIAGPGIPHGETNSRHDLKDVTATLYQLAGVEPPDHIEGSAVDLG